MQLWQKKLNVFSVMNSQETTLNTIFKKIDNSLFPLIFRGENGKVKQNLFSNEYLLVDLAEVLIKFSSLLIQVYWLKIIATRNKEDEKNFVSPELDRILKQIWAGHLQHSIGYSSSILHYASIMDSTTLIGSLIDNPEVLIKWNQIIAFKEDHYKKYESVILEEDIRNLFNRLLESLTILKKISYKEGKLIFKDFNTRVNSFPFFRYFDEYCNPLFLHNINQKEGSVILTFEEPYHSEKFELEISPLNNGEDFDKFTWINKIMGFDNVKNISEGLMYLFDGGYRHIQNIARAIVIKTGDRSEIIEYIENAKKKYGEISPEYPEDIMTLIIAELGPAIVLREILGKNLSYLSLYLEYFENIKLANKKYWEERRENYVKEKLHNIQDIVGLEGSMKKKIESKIKDESYIWCLLNAAGSEQKIKEPFVDSINRRRESIINYKKIWENLNDEEVRDCLKDYPGWTHDIFERTFKFLIIYYRLIACIYALIDKTHLKQLIEIDSLLPDLEEFIEIEYDKIHKETFGTLIRIFNSEVMEGRVTEISEAMKYFLGRDMSFFMKQNSIKSTYDRVCYGANFNWSKHDYVRPNPKEIGSNTLSASVKFFNFLQFGNFDVNSFQKYTLTPIYPMVISFRETHRNREGMNIYYYEIYSFHEEEADSAYKIKILTEQKYYQNEEYYCIPNIKRSSKDWWIDPFLIQCSKFDNVIMKLREKYKWQTKG